MNGAVIPALFCGGESAGGFSQHGLARATCQGYIAGTNCVLAKKRIAGKFKSRPEFRSYRVFRGMVRRIAPIGPIDRYAIRFFAPRTIRRQASSRSASVTLVT